MPSKGIVICLVIILLCWKPAFLQAEAGTVTFKITIDPALLTTALPDLDLSADTDLVPCPIAFVYMRYASPAEFRKSSGLREWYQSVSQPTEPRDVVVNLKDGQLEPQLLVLRAGDSIVQGDFRGTLKMETFNNPAFGLLGIKGTKYRFSQPERSTIKFVLPQDPELFGYLTISDHPYAAISDKEGVVRFTGMPTGMEIPMRVDCPLVDRELYEFTSPDLTIESNGRFTLKLPESEESTIEIRIVKKPETRG